MASCLTRSHWQDFCAYLVGIVRSFKLRMKLHSWRKPCYSIVGVAINSVAILFRPSRPHVSTKLLKCFYNSEISEFLMKKSCSQLLGSYRRCYTVACPRSRTQKVSFSLGSELNSISSPIFKNLEIILLPNNFHPCNEIPGSRVTMRATHFFSFSDFQCLPKLNLLLFLWWMDFLTTDRLIRYRKSNKHGPQNRYGCFAIYGRILSL